jgi:chromosomal replication initiator protein
MITAATVQRAVCDHFRLPVRVMTQCDRSKSIVRPRQVAIYLSCKVANLNRSQVARRFQRDRKTVLHACRKVEALAGVDPAFERDVMTIADRLWGVV